MDMNGQDGPSMKYVHCTVGVSGVSIITITITTTERKDGTFTMMSYFYLPSTPGRFSVPECPSVLSSI